MNAVLGLNFHLVFNFFFYEALSVILFYYWFYPHLIIVAF